LLSPKNFKACLKYRRDLIVLKEGLFTLCTYGMYFRVSFKNTLGHENSCGALLITLYALYSDDDSFFECFDEFSFSGYYKYM